MDIFNSIKNLQEDLCIVLDVGNGSIGGSLVLFHKHNKPEALWSKRVPLHLDEKPMMENLETKVLEFTDDILTSIYKDGIKKEKVQGRKIEKVLCVLSSPWFFSKSKDIKIENQKNFYVTNHFLSDVLDKEVIEFEKSINPTEKSLNFKVIEKTIVQTKIRGYEILNPINKKTDQLEILIYISVANKKFIDKLQNHIEKHTNIHEDHIVFHTFPLACFQTISQISPKDHNFLHFDITGEVTEITYVFGGLIQANASFPCGKNFFVRQISKEFDVSYNIALSLLKLYLEGKSNKETFERVHKVISSCESEWNVYLDDTLLSLSRDMSLPKKIFITADSDLSSLFIQFFNSLKSTSTLSWKKNISVIDVDEKLLSNFFTSKAPVLYDKFLVIDSIFFSKFQ